MEVGVYQVIYDIFFLFLLLFFSKTERRKQDSSKMLFENAFVIVYM